MRTPSAIFSAALLLAVLTIGASAQQRREGALKVGDAATDFTVKDMEGKKSVKLSDLKGKPVVLIFGSCT
jgi:cytochrome oxidase Cu insertion factor (SCO1/SenC/PrrC family)